jgi:hypothetical protein
MHRFTGILRYEIRMSVRRKSLWIAYGLLFLFYTVLLFSPPPLGRGCRGRSSRNLPESHRVSPAAIARRTIRVGAVAKPQLQA